MHHMIIQAYTYLAVNTPWPPKAYVRRSITQSTPGPSRFHLDKRSLQSSSMNPLSVPIKQTQMNARVNEMNHVTETPSVNASNRG